MTDSSPDDGALALRGSATRLTQRVAVIAATLAVVFVALGVVLDQSFAVRDRDAQRIRDAGRLQLLVHQIGSTAAAVIEGEVPNPNVRRPGERLATLAAEALEIHDGRVHRHASDTVDDDLPPGLAGLLAGRDGLEARMHRLLDAVDRIVDPATLPDDRERFVADVVRNVNGAMEHQLHAVVELEQQRAEAGLAADRRLTLVLAALTAVLAMGLSLAGLRPVVRAMRDTADTLAEGQERARRRQHWHTEFAAIADHELRTPVTVLAGLAQTLDQNHDHLEEGLRRDIIARIRRQGDAMSELLGELSTVAGLAGRPPHPTVFDLGELLQEVRGGREDVTVTGPETRVIMDRDRLRLLLSELVDNGLRHGEPPVEVTAHASRTTLVLLVRDDGPGIPTEELERLLRPFAMGSRSENHNRSQGRGLGLAMVASIAQDEDGTLGYDHDGRYGTWRVTLPDVIAPATRRDLHGQPLVTAVPASRVVP